jgi:hypothetical protein
VFRPGRAIAIHLSPVRSVDSPDIASTESDKIDKNANLLLVLPGKSPAYEMLVQCNRGNQTRCLS